MADTVVGIGIEKFAGIAQLIERKLAKLEVVGLSPISRSK
jgi:hypothetical protein